MLIDRRTPECRSGKPVPGSRNEGKSSLVIRTQVKAPGKRTGCDSGKMDMTKYNHVIHPLKQLEEVWGIDLASTLQMYAAEVMEITVEMGGRALNFAQAALLIMGASSIYSKKVDSLQQLVSDTYDLILNRKKDETADSKKKRRTRVVLRQAVPFTEESAAIRAGSKLARTDVMDTMRLLLSGSDCLGFRNAARDQIRINEGELVPFENVVDGGYNYR
eukprot:gene14094-21576_t